MALTLIITASSSASYSTVEGTIFSLDIDGITHTGLATATAAVPSTVFL